MTSIVRARSIIFAVATAAAVATPLTVAAVSVRVEFDKTFDFTPVRTWAWTTPAAGTVIMGRTPDDDPEAAKRNVEPWIRDAAATVLAGRKLQQATAGPDVTLTYYLLLTAGASAQTIGQFLPATTNWGLPPFAPATQSLEIMNQGSLVLDVSANGKIVWRGVAQAKLHLDATDKKREEVVREAVKDLLRRFPPRK